MFKLPMVNDELTSAPLSLSPQTPSSQPRFSRGLIPSHISLPPVPTFTLSTTPDVVSPPYHTAPSSPALQFFTPPTSPLLSPPSLHITIPPPTPTIVTDEPFPTFDYTVHPVIEDEGLSPLEKIYLYARSKATFHKLFILRALPDFLPNIPPPDAVEYVLPLLSGLAVDEDEQVKETLATELVTIVWWFLTNCTISDNPSATDAIPVQSFTLILGTLLLNSNSTVVDSTRHAVVQLLTRLKNADDREGGKEMIVSDSDSDDDHYEAEWVIGSFKREERNMFRNELVQQVIIGMSRLDIDTENVVPLLTSRESGSWDKMDEEAGSWAQQTRLEDSRDNTNDIPERGQDLVSFAILDTSCPPSSPGTAPTVGEARSSSSSSLALPSPSPISDGLSSNVGIRRPLMSVEVLDDGRSGSHVSQDGREESQAAEGRLSSMSLMAAVSASGVLNMDTNEAFVKEVVRVGEDELHWVRSEATYALGALAKVVPEEIVISSLVPLLEKVRRDRAWQVRQSSVFALPAILSRLRGRERRRMALETIEMLWVDEAADVRQGILETLGEVVYTFRGEEEGPPSELVDIFLGRRERKGVFEEGERALVCGFNFPAVAATVGRGGWKEMREVYEELSRHEDVKVRRTLVASVGVLGEIIGGEEAERDLVGVWMAGIGSGWEEVRRCAVESVERLVGVVCRDVGLRMISEVIRVWDSGQFVGWRERERVVKKMERTSEIVKRGLVDPVVAVRKAAIERVAISVPVPDLDLDQFLVNSLKSSSHFQRRMTYIECCQSLTINNKHHHHHLNDLVDDPVVDVRIALARLVASSSSLSAIATRLAKDSSLQVRSFVINNNNSNNNNKLYHNIHNVFSRPPS